MSVKLILKRMIASALIGIPHRVSALSKIKAKAFVLMYHRVLESTNKECIFVQPGMYVSKTTFSSHVKFLKSNFKIISLDELVQRIETGQSLINCCSITFDDGWIDNFTHAFPVIKEYQVPATIFLATNFIGTDKLFWPEELCFYLQQQLTNKLSLPDSIERVIKKEFFFKNDNIKLLDRIIENVKKLDPDERKNIIDELRSTSSKKSPRRLLINWHEAKTMLESGLINFGAHTANHVILDQVSLFKAEQEIIQSREDIDKNLGLHVNHFAYPNGNYNSALIKILTRVGFKSAVTTRKGRLDNKTSFYEIPRIGVHEDVSNTIPLLIARILMKRF
jgi:peptidoglycan/xylan/chitin deacetylase (PgdA/CDA1 family)